MTSYAKNILTLFWQYNNFKFLVCWSTQRPTLQRIRTHCWALIQLGFLKMDDENKDVACPCRTSLRLLWSPGIQPDQLIFWFIDQCLTFLCVWNLLGRHEDLIDSFARFPWSQRNKTLCLALHVWNKKQKYILIVLWKLKIHSPVFVLKSFGFGALKTQVIFKPLPVQN